MNLFSLPDAALGPVAFEAALDGVQEPEGGAAVEDAVVEGDLEVHHAPDGDGVVDHHRALDDGLGLEDGGLRVVDDRGGGDAAQGSGIVDGERAAGEVVRGEVAAPGPSDDVVYAAGEAHDVELVGIRDDGDYQGVFEVDRDADVYSPPQDYPVPVPHGVEDGVL